MTFTAKEINDIVYDKKAITKYGCVLYYIYYIYIQI